ncbi:MAG: hypothetical protein JNK11_01925 [Alphaproteobacteria bacterium]|nr:hypothetical protein [Alphaproteobacteria bacterium]
MRLRTRHRSIALAAAATAMLLAALLLARDVVAQNAIDAGSMSVAPTNPPGTKITRKNRPAERQLCNAYARQFDKAIKTAPAAPNTERAKVLRAEARTACRQGRHGEGHLKLEAALRGIGERPAPSTVIDRRIEQRDERINAIRERRGLPPK